MRATYSIRSRDSDHGVLRAFSTWPYASRRPNWINGFRWAHNLDVSWRERWPKATSSLGSHSRAGKSADKVKGPNGHQIFPLVPSSSHTMASPPLPNSIPVRVFLASLQEYSAQLCQWQAHAEAETREVHSLRGRVADLERENEDMRDCRDILQRMFDTQRELVAALEADLARATAECQFSPCGCDSGASSSSTLSSVIDFGPVDTNSYPVDTLPALEDATEQPTYHKRPADVDISSPSKRLRREEDSSAVGLQIAELLRG